MPGGTLRGALAHRDLRTLLAALTVSWFGDALYRVGLAVFVFDATGSAGWVAVAAVAQLLPFLVLGPYAGVLADRIPKTRLLVTAELTAAAFMAALTAVAVVDGPVPLAVTLAVAIAAAGTPRGPAILALLPEIVDEDDLASANTLTSVTENIATIAGPAASVAMLLTVGPGGAFAVNTVTFLGSAVLLSRLRPGNAGSTGHAGDAAGTWQRLLEGLAAAFGAPSTRACLGFMALACTLTGVDSVLFVLVATEQVDVGSGGLGYLVAAMGVGGILVAPLINRLSSSARLMRCLTVSAVVYCLPSAALALVDNVAVAVVLIAIRGAAFVVIDVVTVTALQRLVPAAALGRVFGVFATVLVAGMMLGAAVVAPTVSLVGVGGALLLSGLLPAVLAVGTYPWLRGLDARTASRRDQLGPALACLERLPILASAPRPALERLAGGAQRVTTGAGSVLIRQGADADAFYVVVEGRLLVSSQAGGADQVPVVLNELGPGEFFGEIGVIQRRPRTATVTAATACTLYRIGGPDFLAAVNDSPAAAPAVRELIGARLARSNTALASPTGGDAVATGESSAGAPGDPS